jgi:hypothetical protein
MSGDYQPAAETGKHEKDRREPENSNGAYPVG